MLFYCCFDCFSCFLSFLFCFCVSWRCFVVVIVFECCCLDCFSCLCCFDCFCLVFYLVVVSFVVVLLFLLFLLFRLILFVLTVLMTNIYGQRKESGNRDIVIVFNCFVLGFHCWLSLFVLLL